MTVDGRVLGVVTATLYLPRIIREKTSRSSRG